MITNRGIKVWPDGFSETFCTDHWRCRFKTDNDRVMNKEEIIALLTKATQNNIDTIKTENLYAFNGKPAFSLGQGQ
jgi:isocitrate dehydrogenase